ncbi:MDM20 [Candida margitis]|uniref:MDM20 n=1 Tax=Candida margitis TaxID=1775924 RepID=UPI002225C95D|nr:MDM20 [Candida margitis]KAI5949630.1 MDM20 [Candida margitis]
MFSQSDEKIIEYIEAGKYTIAQSSLLDKIKKFPNKTIYRALLNKVLYKTGSTAKAIENNLALLKSTPNEITTVIELYEFFKSAGMEKEANLCFESPIQKYPLLSQELGTIWFENSVQDLDIKQFNKIFSFLNKSKKERKYTFWYSFSFYLLFNQGEKEEESKLKLYKSFGKKLIEGLVENEPFVNCQEVYVYTRFLLLDEDYTTIESILSSIKFPLDLELQLLYMEAMEKSGKWTQLHNYTGKLLLEDKFDDYDTWKLWIRSGYETGAALVDLQSKLGNSRNELLIRIELDILYKTDPSQLQSDIEVYFAKFKNKMCCFSDLFKYKDFLSSEFYTMVRNSTDEMLSHPSEGDKDLITLVNNQKFVPHVKNGQIYQHYRGNKSSTNRSEFDNDPLSDALLISIIENLSKDASPQQIIQSITVINHLLINDKYNYKLKVWSIKLYSQLNTNDSILPLYESLKIKMIQHETVGYYLTNVVPATRTSLEQYIDIFRFYLTARHEVKDTVLGGFESQIYSKLTSFIQFGQRLQNSVSLNFILQRIIQTSLITSDKGYINYFAHYLHENEKSILASTWQDNRDFESEWNGIIVNENVETAKSNNLLSTPIDDQSIKLKLIIYMIILNNSTDSTTSLLKQFNKIISSSTQVTSNPFTNVLFKMYYNLLKIQTNIKCDESQSLSNFIHKNLKIDKLKSQIIPHASILSYQLNENLINLIEFIKIVAFISTQSRGKTQDSVKTTKSILQTTTNLVGELKKLDLVQQQYKAIDEQNMSFDLNNELGLELDRDVLEKSVDDIKESIAASTRSILNNI